ncbi:MAG: LuxR C-terminal-related transcriptional regulator [Gammaproteobacteria bacterium]
MFDISSFKSVTNKVINVCKPLFKHFHANYFRLLRIHKDGRRIMLCTNPEVLDLFYGDGWYKYAWLDGDNSKVNKKLVAWQIEKNNMDTKPEFEIYKFLRNLSINEGYAFIYEFDDFYECYDIAAPDAKIYDVDTGLLQRFCFYFKQETADLLREISLDAIKIPANKQLPTNKHSVNKDTFIKETKISKYYFDSDLSYLTSREMECVYYKINGLSAKEIGKLIGISNRTIEVHLENARKKINFLKHVKLITSDIFD